MPESPDSTVAQQTMYATPGETLPERTMPESPDSTVAQQTMYATPGETLPERTMPKSPDSTVAQQTMYATPGETLPERTMPKSPDSTIAQRTMYATPAETPSPYASLPEDEWCRNNSMLAGCLDPQRTMYETPGKTLVPYPSPVPTPVQIPDPERSGQENIMESMALRQSFFSTPKEENLLLQENVKNNTSFKLKPWQWATIGVSATAVVVGGVVVALLIKRHTRNKNEIQIELIDDPALTHALLPS
jgi:hypothetical protein